MDYWLRVGGVVGIGWLVFFAGMLVGSGTANSFDAKSCDKVGATLYGDVAYECGRKEPK